LSGFYRQVCEHLEQAGCNFVRHGKGDHDIWHSPLTRRHITVPYKILSRHTANGICKDAGIGKKF
jgi:predicted RNA binding protein YcfA (HicA-like mRNA interferase family)